MDIETLKSKTRENTDFMNLKDKTYEAKVVYVYDGDTIHVVFYEFGHYFKWNCRIMGVDTPEIRTRNLKEKEFGYKVRNLMRDKLMNQIVKIKVDTFDKYGRLLIDLYMPVDETNETPNSLLLSEWLINNGYAYEYNGGTKQEWTFDTE